MKTKEHNWKGKREKSMIIVLLVLVVGLLICWAHPAKLNPTGNQSINSLERVELGGIKQWISIRGTDRNNPVLLFLHGGPGSANLAKLRLQCPELEQYFVVVNWDQRGAGKSYAAWFSDTPPTLEQLRENTHELVQLLRSRFNGRKIYLVGFSWGSLLGVWTAHDYPEDIEAYISVSQETNLLEAERLSLEYIQQTASNADDQVAVQALSSIIPTYISDDWYNQLMCERKWLLKYGGVYHTTDDYNHEAIMLLKAPEYSFIDFSFWPWSSAKSLKTLWPEVMKVNLFETVPSIEVPFYFLAGRYDHNVPSELTESYFQFLEAPQGKHLIWFENSAHDLFFDQPDLMLSTLVAIRNQ
jgi:pimeloyl-ACP methyl ester carboxylesterase